MESNNLNFNLNLVSTEQNFTKLLNRHPITSIIFLNNPFLHFRYNVVRKLAKFEGFEVNYHYTRHYSADKFPRIIYGIRRCNTYGRWTIHTKHRTINGETVVYIPDHKFQSTIIGSYLFAVLLRITLLDNEKETKYGLESLINMTGKRSYGNIYRQGNLNMTKIINDLLSYFRSSPIPEKNLTPSQNISCTSRFLTKSIYYQHNKVMENKRENTEPRKRKDHKHWEWDYSDTDSIDNQRDHKEVEFSELAQAVLIPPLLGGNDLKSYKRVFRNILNETSTMRDASYNNYCFLGQTSFLVDK